MTEKPQNYSASQPHTIQKMFNQIAGKYDLANHVLSFGTHLIWKKKVVKIFTNSNATKILDCATGTGDIAFMLEKALGSKAKITGIDFSENMLIEARKRAAQTQSNVSFKFADIENLPFADGEFDGVTISFGLRNVSRTDTALKEFARVTKKGGTVVILEFGQPTLVGFKNLYDFYSNKILPFVGGLISGEKSAYKYLNETSSRFPCGEALCQIAKQTDRYSSTEFETLSGGIAYLYRFKV